MPSYDSMTKTELLLEIERLREKEAVMRGMVENVIDGFYRGGIDGVLTFCSPSAARIFGYSSPEEMVGLNIAETFYYDPQERAKVLEDLMRHKIITNYRATLKRKDGAPFAAETNSRIVMDESGTPVAVEGVFRDVTERLRAEEKLQQSEYYYRMLFETTGAATLIIQEDSTIRRCNSHFEKLSGYGKAEIEKRMKWSQFVAPEDLERMREYHEARGRDEQGPPNEYDFVFLDSRGNRKFVRVFVEFLEGSKERIASLIDMTERNKMEQELRKSEERYRCMAITDALTGLYNRRHFYSLAENEVQRSRRNGSDVAVIMLDVDHFKRVNDDFGHDAGDMALQEVAKRIRTVTRTIDVPSRYGGEEFLILLPETDLEGALQVAERLRAELALLSFTTESSRFDLTASLGVNALCNEDAACPTGEEETPRQTLERMIKGADKALYEAKRAGRNTVRSATPNRNETS